MKIEKTSLEDVIIIIPQVFSDERGWFKETYSKSKFCEIGINTEFIQDNHSWSKSMGVIRGLHFQNPPFAQAKLVRCTRGLILDVAVDLRRDSANYLKWTSIELSADNHKQLFIPRGFAHGFLTLSDDVEVEYKVDAPYSKQSERSIRFDDPDISIKWPIEHPILSDKDRLAPYLRDCDCLF
jgi:dTDP-4-dehydrorhamnose 3,5-epimerase